MLVQKLYKNGNSIVVTIPKEYLNDLKLRDGSEVVMEQNTDSGLIVISKKSAQKTNNRISPNFLRWLDTFNKKYSPALKELARR